MSVAAGRRGGQGKSAARPPSRQRWLSPRPGGEHVCQALPSRSRQSAERDGPMYPDRKPSPSAPGRFSRNRIGMCLTVSQAASTICEPSSPTLPPCGHEGWPQSRPRGRRPFMLMTITCPLCGHRCRVPESSIGQRVQCPACSRLFQCGSVSPPSLEARPIPDEKPGTVEATPQVRAAQAQAEPSIRYSCPRCKKGLESPARMANEKVNCPDCGQRLQIPQPPRAPASVPVQVVPSSPPPVPPAPVPEELLPTVLAVPEAPPPPPPRREHCLECGRDVTDRPRVQTCPDCGSLFCSAACYREHHYHAHSSRR